ncbi:MAG: OsmC family protein [Aeriscardovia sp.]|nr:OsmC family protein [Aeriscardovia sp.]
MATKKIMLTKLGDGTVEAVSQSGAKLRLGHMEGVFDPGEVAQIAMAGCAILSSRRETVEDEVRAEVSGEYNPEANRFDSFSLTLFIKGKEEPGKLEQAVQDAIRENCTIARTYERGVKIKVDVEIEKK